MNTTVEAPHHSNESVSPVSDEMISKSTGDPVANIERRLDETSSVETSCPAIIDEGEKSNPMGQNGTLAGGPSNSSESDTINTANQGPDSITANGESVTEAETVFSNFTKHTKYSPFMIFFSVALTVHSSVPCIVKF